MKVMTIITMMKKDCELTAGCRRGLTQQHVRRSSTREKNKKKKTDKEWKLKCLEICQGGMWCKHFYKLEAQFPCGCFFFHVLILILLSLLWCIFGFLEGEDRGLKSWKIGWVEPYVNLGCTLWLFTFKLKLSCGVWFQERSILNSSLVPNTFGLWPL